MICLDSSASSGRFCSACFSDSAALCSEAASDASDEDPALWLVWVFCWAVPPVSSVCGAAGAVCSITLAEPACLAPSWPSAVPFRMPPAPDVVCDTLAGAK